MFYKVAYLFRLYKVINNLKEGYGILISNLKILKKMKKAIGILGILLIMAVSFFNMSSVADINQNVNLTSIIQNASAQSENCDDYEDYRDQTTTSTFPVYEMGEGCTMTYTTHTIECYGWGNIPCTPLDETSDPVIDCPGN